MNIQQTDDSKKGAFFLEVEGEKLALMTYSHAGPGKFIIDHTEVDPSLKGQGVGYKLVEASVEYVRKNNLRIIPLCPFTHAVLRRKVIIQMYYFN